MPYTSRGISGTGIRDGTITLRELAQVSWTITAPLSSGDLTGPPTELTGDMVIDGTSRTLTMTITRDGQNVPTQIAVTVTGYDGDPDATITFTPDRDGNGILIGQSIVIS